jgi:hypothetical protein
MVDLRRADRPYTEALARLAPALEESYAQLVRDGPLPLDGTALTEALLHRLGCFYDAHVRIKGFLGKRYIGAGADFFVESLVFYLRALVETHALDFEVASERAVRRRRGAMRPDITLWRDDTCIGFIECKTQLGWSRHRWRDDFAAREIRFQEDHPERRGFLVVMTSLNWPGFGDDPELGRRYFVISSSWPRVAEPDWVRGTIETPIEGLFKQVVNLSRDV